MNTTPKQTRDLQRLLPLLFAVALGTYIYSPWSAIPMFALVMKVAIFPALAVTGLLLWKWQQMKRRLVDGGKRVIATSRDETAAAALAKQLRPSASVASVGRAIADADLHHHEAVAEQIVS